MNENLYFFGGVGRGKQEEKGALKVVNIEKLYNRI